LFFIVLCVRFNNNNNITWQCSASDVVGSLMVALLQFCAERASKKTKVSQYLIKIWIWTWTWIYEWTWIWIWRHHEYGVLLFGGNSMGVGVVAAAVSSGGK